MRLVPLPPGVELGGHSYCCDFGKSLLKPFLASDPPRFSINENYPRSWNEALYLWCTDFIRWYSDESFYYVSTATRGNWFQANQLEHESNDRTGDTVPSVYVTNKKDMAL